MDYGFTLDPGETIIRVIRRHPIDLLPSAASAAFLVAFAVGLTYLDARFPSSIPFPQLIVATLGGIILLLAGLILLIGVFVFRRNVLVFTSAHLVEVEQLGLFNRTCSQVNFARVQDVTGSRSGILATILNYGDVEVQSAGEQEKFIFRTVADPQGVADDALQNHERFMRTQAAQAVAPQAE